MIDNNLKKLLDISLRIYADDCDPNLVTELLNVLPTKSFRKGERIFTKSGRPLGLNSKTAWIVSREYNGGVELEDAVKYFLNEIKIDAVSINSIRNSGFEKIELFVGIFGYYEAHDFWIGSEQLIFLSQLAIDFGFSYYCVPGE